MRVRLSIVAAVIACSLSPSALFAQAVPAPQPAPGTLSLTDEQKADLLSHNTEASVDAARSGLGSGSPSRQIHGEMGVMIGSHGTRGAYGTAAIPLGDNAGAVVHFEDSRYGYQR